MKVNHLKDHPFCMILINYTPYKTLHIKPLNLMSFYLRSLSSQHVVVLNLQNRVLVVTQIKVKNDPTIINGNVAIIPSRMATKCLCSDAFAIGVINTFQAIVITFA